MCVEDRQERRELWLIIDRCAGGDSLERQSKGLQLGRVCIRAVLSRPCQKVLCDLRSWMQIACMCGSLRFRHGAWCPASSLRRQVDRLPRAWGGCCGSRVAMCCGRVAAWLLGELSFLEARLCRWCGAPLPIRTRGLVLISPTSEGWRAQSTPWCIDSTADRAWTRDPGSTGHYPTPPHHCPTPLHPYPTPPHPTHRANARLRRVSK